MAVNRTIAIKVVADERVSPYIVDGFVHYDSEPMNVGDITVDGTSVLHNVEAAADTADIDEFADNLVAAFAALLAALA